MIGRKVSTKDVIKRATSQLHGEQVPSRNSVEKDELQSYLSQVARKTVGSSMENKNTIKVVDGSDLSISEDDFRRINEPKSSGPSKYMKNKPKVETVTNPVTKNQNITQKKAYKISALNKATALTSYFKNTPAKPIVSDSDFSVTISTDDSVLRELNMSKPKSRERPRTAHSQKPIESSGKPKLSKQSEPVSVPWSESFDKSDDDSLGKGGRRFLKKKPLMGAENMSIDVRGSSSTSFGNGGSPGSAKKLRFNFEKGKPSSPERKVADQPLKPALKTSSSFRSSQEDDVTENVVNAVSSSSSIGSNAQRLGRGARRYVKKTDVLPVAPSADDDAHSGDSDGSYRVNLVMDIDSVDPIYTVIHPVANAEKRTKSPDRPKSSRGPHSKRKTPSPDPFRRKRTPSPEKHRSRSSENRRTPSPNHFRKPKSRSPDPFRRRTMPSPETVRERKSPTPDPFRKRKTPSPELVHKRKTKSPDHQKRKSPSPDPFRSKHAFSPESKKRPKSPEQKRKKDRKKKSENDFFHSMGLQTVDELLGRRSDSEPETKPVKAKKSSSKSKNETNEYLNSFGLQTVEELLGVLPTQSEEEESISMEIPFKSDHSEIASEYDYRLGEQQKESVKRQDSTPYSEDFESSSSEILTMPSETKTPRQFSEDFDSVTLTESESETLKDEESEASSYTYTSEASYISQDGCNRSMHEVEVQTSEAAGLNFRWNQAMGQAYASQAYGLAFADPTPIATHTVSPDTLEAMTAYSPCVLALNDMLRQQLALTKQFLANQNRVYESLLSSISSDYYYTTLAETKRYIEEHRKPRLTFDEALRMVREEMNERR